MRYLLSLCLLLMVGCAGGERVRQYGVMREVLRDRQTEARVRLSDVVAADTIAVGALTGLEGEITVSDGAVWVARREGRSLVVTGPDLASPEESATLLTVARVSGWQVVDLQSSYRLPGVEGRPGADEAIGFAARVSGIDVREPFPFRIEAEFPELELHVIHGACPIAHPDLPAERQPWRWRSEGPVRATVVGFYAEGAGGVMTHHGSAVHAHAVVEVGGRTVTGHVERIVLPERVVIELPAAW